jgi:hypothetical protein
MNTDVENLEEVKKLITELPRDKEKFITGYHFVATEPSIEYYAYEGTQELLIYRNHSTLEHPGPEAKKHSAVTQLEVIINKHCQGISK